MANEGTGDLEELRDSNGNYSVNVFGLGTDNVQVGVYFSYGFDDSEREGPRKVLCYSCDPVVPVVHFSPEQFADFIYKMLVLSGLDVTKCIVMRVSETLFSDDVHRHSIVTHFRNKYGIENLLDNCVDPGEFSDRVMDSFNALFSNFRSEFL